MLAHGGAGAHLPANTLESFQLASRLGATGISSTLWVTNDGIPVIAGSSTIGRGFRRRSIAQVDRSELPPHISTLDEVRTALGPALVLALQLGSPEVASPTLAELHRTGTLGTTWLLHGDGAVLDQIRSVDDAAQLIWVTRLRHITEGPERRAASMRDRAINGLHLHHSDWTGGLTTLFHRFRRYAWADGAHHERVIAEMLSAGTDAVIGSHPDLMVDARRSLGEPYI